MSQQFKIKPISKRHLLLGGNGGPRGKRAARLATGRGG